MTDRELNAYRRNSKRIAKQLYNEKIVDKIDKAKTEGEISRILITARHDIPD